MVVTASCDGDALQTMLNGVRSRLCIFDANVLIADRLWRGQAAKAVLAAIARGDVAGAVPWVAFEEAINNFREQLAGQALVLNRVRKDLSSLGVAFTSEMDVEGETLKCRSWLSSLLSQHAIKVLPMPSITHEDLVTPDLAATKPLSRTERDSATASFDFP